MNENIDSNLTNVEQSSLGEETTEPNGNEISHAGAINTKNLLEQKGKPVLIAEGPGITPPPIRHDISAEPEVTV
jgi:hypothetical protein